ncbi:proton-coupled folate transporter-like isoform X2 [Patiria miniata]|uniref:Major facilitator superfamily (MFS) profile domain-containing protein n=1 Tax=Patiria miniata TaxID=46514 RepID=A0A914B9Q7_PATMI|nr:proton-coupled folate transporter-like isoform X2 [Patiria miniata]XP_038072576.1 proton-coupled folate transporter-like isoform X2 [Patiria miniata]
MEGLRSCPHKVGSATLWFGRQVRQYVTVEPVMLFYMLGSFLQYSAVIQLLYLKLCVIKFNDTSACQSLSSHPDMEKYTQDAGSNWLIILNAFLTVASIASTLFYGAWSDRVGRRVTIILPAVGSIINGIVLILCARFMLSSPWYVVVGTALMGLFGSFPTLTTAVFSYMGDVTNSDNRTMRFSILEAMTFSGSFIGLITAGVVIDNAGYIAAFAYYIACNVVVVLYTIFWLRESVPSSSPSNAATDSDIKVLVDDIDSQVETDLGTPDAAPKGCCRELVRFENVKSIVRILIKKRPHYGRLQIFLLISCLFTLQLVGEGFTDTIILYLKKDPLEFDASTIGFFQGLKNGLTALTLIVGMPLLRLTRLHDTVIAFVALLFRSGAFVMIAFARQRLTVFLMPILYCPSGIPAAVTRALLSKNVGLNEQGGLFSLTGALETMTTLLSSAIFNALYPATKSIIGGGFVFIVMAVLLIIPMLLMMWVHDLQKGNTAYNLARQPASEGNESSIYGDT